MTYCFELVTGLTRQVVLVHGAGRLGCKVLVGSLDFVDPCSRTRSMAYVVCAKGSRRRQAPNVTKRVCHALAKFNS